VDEQVNKVRNAAADKEWLQFQLDNADADLRDAIREALAAGVLAEELVDPAELTIEQIKAILRNDS
jgi:hypothetical protein